MSKPVEQPERILTLAEVLEGTGLACPKMNRGLKITGLAADSRLVENGSLFVAISGATVDGHDFLEMALARGASALVVSNPTRVKPEWRKKVPVFIVSEGRDVLAPLAANFYGHPERQLALLGITGTNGKTTTSYLLESIISAAGGVPGVIGTVNYRYCGRLITGSFTTPEPVALFRLMREMVDNGVSHLVMEVSSHALTQGRMKGLAFDLAIFTNLSRDHLDFHSTMAEYFAAKKSLFTEHLKEDGAALVILGKPVGDAAEPVQDWGELLVKDLLASGGFRPWAAGPAGKYKNGGRILLTAGIARGDLCARQAALSLAGIDTVLEFPDGEQLALSSPLTGEFNLENLLAAAGGGWLSGFSREALVLGLGKLARVPGRLEKVENPSVASGAASCRVFVDYAHTPDALARVLDTLRKLAIGRLVVIFGCGGDRDRGKRPLMGEVAGRGGDVVLITSDNPRSEDPAAIMTEIEQGLYPGGIAHLPRSRAEHLLAGTGRGYDLIVSRRAAIRTALRFARNDDVVLLAGKGHEDYQIVGQRRDYFDDRREALLQMAVIRR